MQGNMEAIFKNNKIESSAGSTLAFSKIGDNVPSLKLIV